MSRFIVLSLGAGVQSSCMAMMCKHGELEMPVAAVFADTGDESDATYAYLNWLEVTLPFPVIRAKNTIKVSDDDDGKPIKQEMSLSEHVFKSIDEGTRVSKPPLFTKGVSNRSEGLLTRDCTKDFKVAVIQREVRKLMKKHDKKHVFQWIGISLDESIRMKPSRVNYSTHEWPLIMEKRMTRHDCLNWMRSHGYPEPPRSACVYCPHHDNSEWRRIRDEEPESWQRAVEFDAKIRRGIHGVRAECYVHRSCVPLDEVDLSTDYENGQGLLWGNECEGLCGV